MYVRINVLIYVSVPFDQYSSPFCHRPASCKHLPCVSVSFVLNSHICKIKYAAFVSLCLASLFKTFLQAHSFVTNGKIVSFLTSKLCSAVYIFRYIHFPLLIFIRKKIVLLVCMCE